MQQLDHQDVRWKQRTFPLIIACDNWADPRNVGMAFRLADAFGVEVLWLGEQTPCPPNRKLRRTARATVDWIQWTHHTDLTQALVDAKAAGWFLLGLEITDRSVPLGEYVRQPLPEKIVLVVGAENEGIGVASLRALDTCVHVPMYGQNSSLNVATALAITLAKLTDAYSAS